MIELPAYYCAYIGHTLISVIVILEAITPPYIRPPDLPLNVNVAEAPLPELARTLNVVAEAVPDTILCLKTMQHVWLVRFALAPCPAAKAPAVLS